MLCVAWRLGVVCMSPPRGVPDGWHQSCYAYSVRRNSGRRHAASATASAVNAPPSATAWGVPIRSASAPTCKAPSGASPTKTNARSEEHTSELQSLAYLVCRLLLEKKKNDIRSEDQTSELQSLSYLLCRFLLDKTKITKSAIRTDTQQHTSLTNSHKTQPTNYHETDT